MKLVHEKGHLKRIFTQNIDTLERLTGIPSDKVVEAHGSFAANHCIDCQAELSIQDLQKAMYPGGGNKLNKGEKVGIPRCLSNNCKTKNGGIVKPDIVFFGEGLPERFFDLAEKDIPEADLVIVAGTSLTVHPFASLPEEANCQRLLFNIQPVGSFGKKRSDVLVLGDCDAEIEKFIELCGWKKELEVLQREVYGDRQEKPDPKINSKETPITNNQAKLFELVKEDNDLKGSNLEKLVNSMDKMPKEPINGAEFITTKGTSMPNKAKNICVTELEGPTTDHSKEGNNSTDLSQVKIDTETGAYGDNGTEDKHDARLDTQVETPTEDLVDEFASKMNIR